MTAKGNARRASTAVAFGRTPRIGYKARSCSITDDTHDTDAHGAGLRHAYFFLRYGGDALTL